MTAIPASLALTTISGEITAAPHNNNNSAIQSAVNDLIGYLNNGYTTYTPTWTSSGTAPAIGNSTVVARYAQVGKLVHCHGRITFGNTSMNFGSGNYFFALPPVTAASNAISSGAPGIVYLSDASPQALMFGASAIQAGGTTFNIGYGATYGGTPTAVGAAAPWTWTTSDFIAWNFCYEAA